MKINIKLTIVLLFSSVLLFGQTHNFKPPKKTNTIILEKESKAVDFLIDYAKHLQDYGYAIEKIDKDLLSLSTEFKGYKFGGVAVVKIIAFAREKGTQSTLTIKGKIEVTNPLAGGQVPFEAANKGMSGDAQRNGFNEILNTLHEFNYDSIEFEIK